MERKNTGQLSLAYTGNLRDNRQRRRLGSVLPSSNAIITITIIITPFNILGLNGKMPGYAPAAIVYGTIYIQTKNIFIHCT